MRESKQRVRSKTYGKLSTRRGNYEYNLPWRRRRKNNKRTNGRLRSASDHGAGAGAGAGAEEEDEETHMRCVDCDVVIIGAGVSGLACAKRLDEMMPPQAKIVLVDAADKVGGRVRTDSVDGFMLDRGFQIFLQGYSRLRESKLIDFDALQLQDFYNGAMVRLGARSQENDDDNTTTTSNNGVDEKVHYARIADPTRHPIDGVASLLNDVGSPLDKITVGVLRLGAALSSPEKLLSAMPETSSYDALRRAGLSEAMIDRFFRPFLGGIFFDRELRTSSRMLFFILRSLALGANSLPSEGMEAVPRQMEAALSDRVELLLGHRAESLRDFTSGGDGSEGDNDDVEDDDDDNGITVSLIATSSAVAAEGQGEGGDKRENEEELQQHQHRVRLRAAHCVVATEGGQKCDALLGDRLVRAGIESHTGEPVSTACVYLSLPEDDIPSTDPILYLNGERDANLLVNNLCFPSTVCRAYAPKGRHLLSASVIGLAEDIGDDRSLGEAVREEVASQWFPQVSGVRKWELLRVYRVPYAQPPQRSPTNLERDVALPGGRLFVCGDHRETASLEGAVLSGARAARAVVDSIGVNASSAASA